MSTWLDRHVAAQAQQLGEWAVNLIADAALADEVISADELEEFAAKQRRNRAAETES